MLIVNHSAVILIVAKNHDEKFGPWSSHVRNAMNNDPEVAANSEKVPPPPVGPRPVHLATDLPAVSGEQKSSYADEYRGQESNGAAPLQDRASSAHHQPASFEQADGTRPISTV